MLHYLICCIGHKFIKTTIQKLQIDTINRPCAVIVIRIKVPRFQVFPISHKHTFQLCEDMPCRYHFLYILLPVANASETNGNLPAKATACDQINHKTTVIRTIRNQYNDFDTWVILAQNPRLDQNLKRKMFLFPPLVFK